MSVLMNFSMGLKSAAAAKAVSALANRWYPVKTSDQRAVGAGIVFVNGEFWSFDNNSSTAKVSTDGKTWQTVWFGTAFPKNETAVPLITGIAFNNGKYVAVGRTFSGTAIILTSFDKVNWTRVTTTHAQDLNWIVYLNGLNMFFAVGQGGYTMRSIDGDNWVVGTRLGTTTLTSAFFNGSTIAVTVSGSGVIYRSSDGINFLNSSTGTTAVAQVTYSPTTGLWMATRASGSGAIATSSSDLVSWTARGIGGTGVPAGTPNGTGIVWDGNKFIMTTSTAVFNSVDGLAFTIANSRINTLGMIGVDLNTGICVAGANGNTGVVRTTDSGVTWSSDISEKNVITPFIRRGVNLAFTASASFYGRHWRSTQGGNILSSEDGREWTVSNVHTSVTGDINDICGALNASTPYFTAVGLQGSAAQILISTDYGKNWNVASGGANSGVVFNSCASNGTLTVAVGTSGRILTSTDGTTWTQRVVSGLSASLVSVTYAGGRFVAVGINTAITSTDGITWTNASTSFTTGGAVNPNVVTYDGTKFVVAGVGTATVNIKTSTDGVTWANGTYAPWGTSTVRDIVQSGAAFVVMLSGARTNLFYRTGNFVSFNTAFAYGAIQSTGIPSISIANGKILITGSQGSYFYSSENNGDTIEIEPMAEPTVSPIANRFRLRVIDDEVCMLNSSAFEGPVLSVLDPTDNLFRNEAFPGAPTALVFNGTQYILATSPSASTCSILTSPDRINWTSRLSLNSTIVGFATNGSTVVACNHGIGGGTELGIHYSLNNGNTWAAGNIAFSVNKILWAGDKFVAVGRNSGGSGVIATSADGVTWTTAFSSTGHNFTDLVFAKGILMAVSSGTSQKIMTSTDGSVWSPQGLSSYSPAQCAIYVESIDRFLIGTAAGGIYSSSDTVNWSLESLGTTPLLTMIYDEISAIYAMNSRGVLFKYSVE